LIFTVQLPIENLFGVGENDIPKLLLRPSCDAGYYVFLHSLAPGNYMISWSAPSGSQDITYKLTIQ